MVRIALGGLEYESVCWVTWLLLQGSRHCGAVSLFPFGTGNSTNLLREPRYRRCLVLCCFDIEMSAMSVNPNIKRLLATSGAYYSLARIY